MMTKLFKRISKWVNVDPVVAKYHDKSFLMISPHHKFS